MQYTPPLARLIDAFQKLPGVGPKSAQRLAFHVLKQSPADVHQFSQALVEAREVIKRCGVCFNLTCEPTCEICQSTSRERKTVCVIQEAQDLYALEKTGEFRGQYHILEGLISPLEGIGPQDIRIPELITRLSQPDNEIQEVILALPPSVEGDTTSLYLSKLIKPLSVSISRIAFGLPVGGDIEYADSLTLTRAMAGRVAI